MSITSLIKQSCLRLKKIIAGKLGLTVFGILIILFAVCLVVFIWPKDSVNEYDSALTQQKTEELYQMPSSNFNHEKDLPEDQIAVAVSCQRIINECPGTPEAEKAKKPGCHPL